MPSLQHFLSPGADQQGGCLRAVLLLTRFTSMYSPLPRNRQNTNTNICSHVIIGEADMLGRRQQEIYVRAHVCMRGSCVDGSSDFCSRKSFSHRLHVRILARSYFVKKGLCQQFCSMDSELVAPTARSTHQMVWGKDRSRQVIPSRGVVRMWAGQW